MFTAGSLTEPQGHEVKPQEGFISRNKSSQSRKASILTRRKWFNKRRNLFLIVGHGYAASYGLNKKREKSVGYTDAMNGNIHIAVLPEIRYITRSPGFFKGKMGNVIEGVVELIMRAGRICYEWGAKYH